MFGLDAAAVAKQPGERRRAAQPVPLIRAYCGFAVALDREPGAALGAPCTQDLAAADAFHPGAKAVRPLAPDDRRLVGALHDLFPFKKSLTLERFAYRPVKIIRFEVLVQYEPSFGYKYLGKAPAVIDSGQDFHLDLAPNGFRHNPKGAVSGRRYMVFAKPKFNNKNIDDAGDVLRGELTSLTLDEALDIINNWRASHSYPLQAIKMMLRNRAHSIDKRPSSRND